MTRVIEPQLLPRSLGENVDLKGRRGGFRRICRQEAGFEDVRLLDNGLEARIEDVLYPSTHDLVGRQGEEMTKRFVGEGDAQVGVEDERADR